jgi:methenyltetrahydromethanopterin cyclohydrolase
MLFSPARVLVTALGSGETFEAGRLNYELLDVSFG